MIAGLLFAIPALLFLIVSFFGILSIPVKMLQGKFQLDSRETGNTVAFTITALALSGISICYIISGKALTNYKSWATKLAGYIVAVLSLLCFPIGAINELDYHYISAI